MTRSAEEAEPILVHAMRRRPRGEVCHDSREPGIGKIGTSPATFLSEYDEAIAEAERRGAVKALRNLAEDSDTPNDLVGPNVHTWVTARADAIENGADL